MRSLRLSAPVLAALLLLLHPAPAGAEVLPPQKGALVAIPSRMELKAPPAKVWSVLCSVKGFSALTGFQADAAAGRKVFRRIGDSVRASIWSDKGVLVVTGYAPVSELRVAWEPENGGYLCSKKIVLQKTPAGTRLTMLDRYTDDKPDVDATARKVAEETATAGNAFRAMVEGQ